MRAEDSPFRPYWWGTSLEGAEARPDVGTYGRYSFSDLPPIPVALTGELAWLAAQPSHDQWPITTSSAANLEVLVAACRDKGLSLPPAFVRFMAAPDLQDRVRSSTACFIDLDVAPVPVPASVSAAGGYLIRFLADQQGCLFWYLYLTADGSDHAVVSSEDMYDSANDESDVFEPDDDDDDDCEISFCGESFEAFLYRFWLENEVWFATEDGTPMPVGGKEYLDSYGGGS